MAELKTKDGLIVGLIEQPPEPQKEKSEGAKPKDSAAQKNNRGRNHDD